MRVANIRWLGDDAPMAGRNVLGGELRLCSSDPVTGFYRDGCCTSGRRDVTLHTVCALMTKEFLEHQRDHGNDLITPNERMAFPGLKPGDSWCVTAHAWLQAWEDGVAPPVFLEATNHITLQVIPLARLRFHAVEIPEDLSGLAGD